MTESITAVLHLSRPPERVWEAITDPARIEAWLMPNDFRPVLGHRFTFRTRPIPPHFDGIVHCEVIALEPPRRLAYTWAGGGLDTVVSYRLEPQGDGTILHFEHSGFDPDRPTDRMAFKGMEPGWTRHMQVGLERVLAAMAAS